MIRELAYGCRSYESGLRRLKSNSKQLDAAIPAADPTKPNRPSDNSRRTAGAATPTKGLNDQPKAAPPAGSADKGRPVERQGCR